MAVKPMRMPRETPPDSESTEATARPTGSRSPSDADLHVRNYHVHASHTVEVTVFADPDSVTFSKRYHLNPGQSENERDVLSAGTDTVEIRRDRLRRDRAQCDVGDGSDQTAMIEIGNGAISITQDSY
jgi:hypothetical protein